MRTGCGVAPPRMYFPQSDPLWATTFSENAKLHLQLCKNILTAFAEIFKNEIEQRDDLQTAPTAVLGIRTRIFAV